MLYYFITRDRFDWEYLTDSTNLLCCCPYKDFSCRLNVQLSRYQEKLRSNIQSLADGKGDYVNKPSDRYEALDSLLNTSLGYKGPGIRYHRLIIQLGNECTCVEQRRETRGEAGGTDAEEQK
jgi:hypothetical protein